MTAVNYLAPSVLTDVLRDKFTHSAPARIITVASRASRQAGDINPLRDLTDTADYTRRESQRLCGRTKLMDIPPSSSSTSDGRRPNNGPRG
jgi:hypothetical protein